MLKDIQKIWAELLPGTKADIIKEISKEKKANEVGIKTNWFSSWKIPESQQAAVLKKVKRELKKQINRGTKLV